MMVCAATTRRGLVVLVILLVMAVRAVAMPAPVPGPMNVDGFQFTLSSGYLFEGGEFYLDDLGGGQLKVDGDFVTYSLVGVSYVIDPCPLIDDLSALSGTPAEGLFAASNGAVACGLTVVGTIRNVVAGVDVFTGTILTADIVSSFSVREVIPMGPSSLMKAQIDMVVTGGELSGRVADGFETDMKIWDGITAVHQFMTATQMSSLGQGVQDFDLDLGHEIEYGGGTVLFQEIPEPVSMALLGFGALGIAWRKRS